MVVRSDFQRFKHFRHFKHFFRYFEYFALQVLPKKNAPPALRRTVRSHFTLLIVVIRDQNVKRATSE